eukprot:scaffold2264_cov114-Isochrysis_galbana.AAC.6
MAGRSRPDRAAPGQSACASSWPGRVGATGLTASHSEAAVVSSAAASPVHSASSPSNARESIARVCTHDGSGSRLSCEAESGREPCSTKRAGDRPSEWSPAHCPLMPYSMPSESRQVICSPARERKGSRGTPLVSKASRRIRQGSATEPAPVVHRRRASVSVRLQGVRRAQKWPMHAYRRRTKAPAVPLPDRGVVCGSL